MITKIRKQEILEEAKKYHGKSLYEIIRLYDDLSVLTADLSQLNISPTPSGLILFSEKKYKIYIHDGCNENRKRFTLAHEIGHYCLHKDYLQDTGPFIDNDNTLYNRPGYIDLPEDVKNKEEEANFFAAEILMPGNLVKEAYNKNDSIEKLANFFSVSAEAMFYRLKNLSLIS
ncbi:MAG: ImmA/IrrE family metallo-endopeptidase [candidate division SR1 bacterium]|nr:ImmA/IrrE family metallo-endopeptidase [candidate division SR1 bacterium]